MLTSARISNASPDSRLEATSKSSVPNNYTHPRTEMVYLASCLYNTTPGHWSIEYMGTIESSPYFSGNTEHVLPTPTGYAPLLDKGTRTVVKSSPECPTNGAYYEISSIPDRFWKLAPTSPRNTWPGKDKATNVSWNWTGRS